MPAIGAVGLGPRLAGQRAAGGADGRPFTPRVSFDNSNTGNLGGQFGYDRPDEVAGRDAGRGRATPAAPS